ncbi:dephospho-CoA kinase [Nitratireductor sp. StC3]|uniref:dephospho-CoA kinase n=1 Tax=Nitratireductor sp. StC3 TaxID=2126741 RepID=UPI000D0DA8F3|nr:dephospho-CoA kinase [Nitratireductor sp. StC3]PSM19305.1 dephospho-CoA kinase [Nitratireductor sp. StC3]
MIVLGLTGSIGMGKSTTARFFAECGVPVHDADAAVHALYEGKAVPLVGARFPEAIVAGKVDRARLAEQVLGKPEALRALEAIVHPLVRAAELEFLAAHRKKGTPLVVLDIPLLYETGGEHRVDRVLVVTAPPEVQRERVLARPGMTPERLQNILDKQVPDAEKRRRADFVLDTGLGMDHARRRVAEIVDTLTGKPEKEPRD